MAKFLDETGLTTLWGKVKDHDETILTLAKEYADGVVKGFDHTLIKVVEQSVITANTAPETADLNKIFLVSNSQTSGSNIFTEYVWVADKSAYEKLGEYKSDVDLSEYMKTTTANAAFISSISASGNNTIKYTKGDGSTGTTNEVYKLPAASSSALGGIKIGYTQTGKNYPVVLDSSSKAYVNVPWTDYSAMTGATSSAAGKAGLVPAPAANQQTYFLNGAGTWEEIGTLDVDTIITD